jgi:hypothetical protein
LWCGSLSGPAFGISVQVPFCFVFHFVSAFFLTLETFSGASPVESFFGLFVYSTVCIFFTFCCYLFDLIFPFDSFVHVN